VRFISDVVFEKKLVFIPDEIADRRRSLRGCPEDREEEELLEQAPGGRCLGLNGASGGIFSVTLMG